MRKLSLTFPQEIADELSLLCLNHPIVCKKEGTMGWTSNDRIIIVRRGYLEYYNLHPGFVEGQPLSIKNKYFKGAVRLDFIHQVNYLPRNKIRKNYIELIFPKIRKMGRQPTQTQQEEEEIPETNISKDEQQEKWIFEFKMDVKQWVEQKREQQKEQKRNMSKLTQEEPEENATPNNINSSPSTPLPEEDIHEKNIEEYVEAIQRTKQYLKTKAEMAQEEAARQKKKKEQKMAQLLSTKNQNIEQSYSISPFWRDYYRAFEQVVSEKNKNSIETSFSTELNMLRSVEYFNSISTKIIENYVDERAIGWDGAKKQMERFFYYQGLWLRVGGKQLNQQFLVNYYLNDIFYSLPDIKRFKFRVPMMSLFKYKGLKILAMCDMPFSELQKTEVYNLIEDGFDLQLMGKLKESLQVMEDILNVKSQTIEIDPKKKITAPLGINLKIYQYNFKKDKAQDQILIPNFYYLINPGIVFPLDYLSQKIQLNPLARLRPELIAAYRDSKLNEDTQLLSQAFMTSSMPDQFTKHEDAKVIDACRLLEKGKIKQLADKLNNIDLLIVDSYSLKSMMQQMGISMRHIGLLSKLAEIPYIREHLTIQALARTIKKQFTSTLKELEKQQFLLHQDQYAQMKNTDRIVLVRERKAKGQRQYKQFALDYLNLVFGCGEESKQFWKIIVRKCSQYFKLDSQYPPTVKPGALLHAVLWHCHLKVSFNKDVPLFTSDYPFSQSSKIQYKMSIKTFDFPSFQLHKKFKSAPSLEDHVTTSVFQQSTDKLLKLQLLFYNTINFSFESAVAISKMSNQKEYLSKIEAENPYHPVVIPYYLINKSQYNFHRALQILNFSLPETHPLFITLHIQYSSVLQPQLLKKTALLLAVKSFGQFHPKTTQIYSKLYHEGATEYYIKATRLTTVEACGVMCREMFESQKYESCLRFVLQQISKMNSKDSGQRLGAGNFKIYLQMLMQGLESATSILEFTKGLIISQQISSVISSFKLKDLACTYNIFKHVIKIHLLQSQKKYFLYKLVLLAVHIRINHEKVELDEEGCTLPVKGLQQQRLLEGVSDEYYEYETHSKWIKFIIETLTKSFQYFNYLQDLFNNYASHISRYNNDTFKHCLGYWDICIRVYGQAFFKDSLYEVKFN